MEFTVEELVLDAFVVLVLLFVEVDDDVVPLPLSLLVEVLDVFAVELLVLAVLVVPLGPAAVLFVEVVLVEPVVLVLVLLVLCVLAA